MKESVWFSFSCTSTGTVVTSCDLCHSEASCLKSHGRGDTFSSHALSCACKEGFVGDGLMCYDVKLCSDSSCCEDGYQWSPDRGCVDTDECSLKNSPCRPPQVCRNTPGSFECLEPFANTESSPSSQSVQFSCGNTLCPLGMDCIRYNGTSRCADPCLYHTWLNDEWRSTDNPSTANHHCDRDVEWQGWYRLFLGQTNAQIPEKCIPDDRCGTSSPLSLTTPHPTQQDLIVNGSVCGTWLGECCRLKSPPVHVKLCHGGYYVYKLFRPYGCDLAYCAGRLLSYLKHLYSVATISNLHFKSGLWTGLKNEHKIRNFWILYVLGQNQNTEVMGTS